MSTEITYTVTVLLPDSVSKVTPKMDAAAFVPELSQAIEQRVAPMEVLNIDVAEVIHDPEYY